MHYVIIGNGVAGVMAAETIRQEDPKGNITMIGDEIALPYCRPMISMVLDGSIDPGALSIRKPSFYQDLKIEPILGQRVSNIDVEGKAVRISDGSSIKFEKLLIATGADPIPLKAEGLKLKNIFYMRNSSHVQEILEALPQAKAAVVLGGGLVGFKAAHGLHHRGLKVTMVEKLDYPLPLLVDPFAGRLISDELTRRNIVVKSGTEPVRFEGNGSVKSVCLADGSEIPCDLAVIGIGVRPALSFLSKDEIKTDFGVLVNQQMETSVAGIYAAGDVVQATDIARKIKWVNAIWPEAITQGRIAGMNMAGRAVSYKGSLSRNVIRIFELDVMAGGLVKPPPEAQYNIVSSTDRKRQTYRKLVFDEERLVGMVMVNSIEQGGALLSLMHSQNPITIPHEVLLQPSFNFKHLMKY